MGVKGVKFTYKDLESLSDSQLIRRYKRELSEGTYHSASTYHNRLIASIVRLYDNNPHMTYDHRKKLINFQYYNDPSSDSPSKKTRSIPESGNTRSFTNPYFTGSFSFDESDYTSNK